MISQSLEDLAREFWADTGGDDTFPREIAPFVALKLPLVSVQLPQLHVLAVRQWLQQHGMTTPVPTDRRELHGCLVAHRGCGVIFVCAIDRPEEQRLTMAHEVAHFLIDYHWPRQLLLHTLGEGIAAVLDGIRPATAEERAAAILSRLHLGPHLHILPRPGRGSDSDGVLAQAEDRADRLALELVAPQASVRAILAALSARQAWTPEAVRTALALHFGLPGYAFDTTIQRLFWRQPTSFVADLRAALRRPR